MIHPVGGSTAVALILVALVLVPLGGLFAAIDAALATVSIARIREMVKADRSGAARAAQILTDRPRYVNLVVLLRILCELSATVLFVGTCLAWLSPGWALGLPVVVMVLVDYVVIGVGPRTLGRQNAYTIVLSLSLPLQILGRVLGPIGQLLVLIGNAITPGKGFRNGPFASEVELRELVDLAQERGVVDADEGRMIQSVFELGDTPAREVMVPRTDMVWIEADKSAGQATALAVRSGHSRIPVIGENVDDVLGVVYLKDLVQQTYYSSDGGRSVTVGEVMRPAIFVPDTKPLNTLLADMQRIANHMAVLVDEYGGVAGLVTMEDLIEEIVGEIADEYDQGEVAPFEALDDGGYRVSARLPLEDLGELFDTEIDEDEVDTVGGLMGVELGRVPLPGSEVVSHGLVLRGEGGQTGRGRIRIQTVLVHRAPDSAPDPEDDDR